MWKVFINTESWFKFKIYSFTFNSCPVGLNGEFAWPVLALHPVPHSSVLMVIPTKMFVYTSHPIQLFRSHPWCLHPTTRSWSLLMDMPTTMLLSGNIPLSVKLQSSMVNKSRPHKGTSSELRTCCSSFLLV